MDKILPLFIQWTKLKIRIQLSKNRLYCKEGEVWWASMGINIGVEENGKHEKFERPVLILKVFNKHMFWAIPFTSQPKLSPYYISIVFNEKTSYLILSQVRLLSTKRLRRKVAKISFNELLKIRGEVKKLL